MLAGGAPGDAPGLPRCTGLPVPLGAPDASCSLAKRGSPRAMSPPGDSRPVHRGRSPAPRGGLPVQLPRPSSTPTSGCSAPPPSTHVPRRPRGTGTPPPRREGARHLAVRGPRGRGRTEWRDLSPWTTRSRQLVRDVRAAAVPRAGPFVLYGVGVSGATWWGPASRCRARPPAVGRREGAVPRGTRTTVRGCAPIPRPSVPGTTADARSPPPADRLDGECFRSSSMRPDDRGRLPRPGWSSVPRLLAGTRQPAPRGVGPGAPPGSPGTHGRRGARGGIVPRDSLARGSAHGVNPPLSRYRYPPPSYLL